ncbi:RNB-domain-containing protein [Aureobasidium pullulans]|uniref:RNB-domain-containing protein n=1 Tax=Aureobasidium pullulans TaxID=5580 RepID=A0A4S9LZT2_AURPU|nr:RNB-domain-containing protein [Aureobasidium pullulans]
MLSIRSDSARRRPDLAKMCWSCALKQQRWSSVARPTTQPNTIRITSRRIPSSSRPPRNAFFSSYSRSQQRFALDSTSDSPVYNPAIESLDRLEPLDTPRIGGIRDQLRKWHEEHGHEQSNVVHDHDVNALGETTNNFTRLSDVDNLRRPHESLENDRDDTSQLAQAHPADLEDWDPNHRFLRRGDMVVLDFPRSEREPLLAIFVRRVGRPLQSQFYTIQGKWIHATERNIQHAVLSFVDPSFVDPIIPHLPDEGITEDLLDRAQMFDLSVPRHVSAPLVTRMLEFQRKSDEIYRQHATTLDNAHHLLAHPTDLKFGTLDLIASRLLGKEKNDSLTQEKIYAVRNALTRGGFAFGHDRRSHRLTGFIQIRSKEQVANVEKVRNWLRSWQDDLAIFAAGKDATHQFSRSGQHVVNFIHKAQSLIRKSRELRDVTPYGRVGSSKKRFDINKQDVVQYEHTEEFDDPDRELIKFMEAWTCSGLFLGLPRVEALPPLLLQATGMYEEHNMDPKTGFTFLQEIGVLTPHENRVRFDSHLLLPSSQHSKPLEQLMTKIMEMNNNHGFVDSMAHLRKDWGDLPVFCIDGEGAHEIDDGVSVEDAGEGEHWVHIHIANPTAFFEHDNPLAKMARHMTETIYMPERAFVMLPRWSTKKHFSLQANRPCLTFSARMNLQGETLEHKIQPGFIRNVKFITPAEAARLVGVDSGVRPDVTLRVGGDPPHRTPKKTGNNLLTHEIDMLKKMQMLAERRQANRRSAGGLFLDSNQPDFTIWQQKNNPGLGWEHPSRTRARYVQGDPIIEYRTKELTSWFSTGEGVSDILVRELMLLACEIGATWCAERNIPLIYRGTVDSPDIKDANVYYNEVLAPATEKNNGEAPMHLAIEYLRNSGSTILTTKPLHHRVLGLPSYSKATSPLRRYGDMVLHWQVEAALREEAKAGQKLDFGGKNQSMLPFSNGALTTMATGLQPRESMIRRATNYAEQHWLCSLFFRAHYYNECELPSKFHAYIHMMPVSQTANLPILIKEYSAAGNMLMPEAYGLGQAKAGDTWECVIEQVMCFERNIQFRPVRLVDRWQE